MLLSENAWIWNKFNAKKYQQKKREFKSKQLLCRKKQRLQLVSVMLSSVHSILNPYRTTTSVFYSFYCMLSLSLNLAAFLITRSSYYGPNYSQNVVVDIL